MAKGKHDNMIMAAIILGVPAVMLGLAAWAESGTKKDVSGDKFLEFMKKFSPVPIKTTMAREGQKVGDADLSVVYYNPYYLEVYQPQGGVLKTQEKTTALLKAYAEGDEAAKNIVNKVLEGT